MSTISIAGAPGGIPVLYFHGAAAHRDEGPNDELCVEGGVRILRHVRPGYDATPTAPIADLSDVALDAVREAEDLVPGPFVVMGWSGGGPYALAAGALARPSVRGVCLLGSWAPMNPPDAGLPFAVRGFMRAGKVLPRWLLKGALGAGGFRNAGHVDDVRRVARPWGFEVAAVVESTPVAAFHSLSDPEVPVGPWRSFDDLALTETPDNGHIPTPDVWTSALAWTTSTFVRSEQEPS